MRIARQTCSAYLPVHIDGKKIQFPIKYFVVEPKPAPKDLNKEILTANEMMKQAVRLRKHFQQDIQAAGIAINANQAKPSVLPTSASPEWLPPAPVRCETPGTPLVYEVQLERQRRQEAEDEIDRLKAELRACRSRTSSTTTTRSSGHWPSRETQTPRSTSRSAHLDAINCFGEPPRGTKGPNGADRARKKVAAAARTRCPYTASAFTVQSNPVSGNS